MPLSILWLQHDAAFGFATAAWNWPRPIRDLLSPEAELLTEVETGGWQFKPGDSGPFAHIWYCRTVNQAARIPRGLNFDLAFVKVPLEVYGHEGSSLGDDDRIPSESTLADAEATRRWIKALIEHRWSGCHVCVFEEHHPAPQIGINPRAALPSQDAKKLRDALRKVQEQRQLQLLSRFGVQQVVRWQQELEQSKGSVDLVLRCLTESASTLGSPGAGPSDSRLAEFFPDLALKAALHMPWESLERNWLDAEQVLIKAAPPHAKLIFLTRLLRARNFDWDNRATFNLQNLAGLGLGPLVSRHAIQNYTPVELPFHLPKAVRNDPDWPKVWEGVQRAALNQIDCALELDFDSGTKNALNEIKSLLLGRTAESGPPTNEEKQPYDPGFRRSPEHLRELVDDEIDGCPFEFQ